MPLPPRRLLPLVLFAALLAPVTAAAAADCATPGSPRYTTHACKVQRLRARSFVVVAVVDTGINPYHHDFRLPADDDLAGVHPSEFISGFPPPESAQPMPLTLDEGSYDAAFAADEFEWQKVQQDRLYTFPGTKVIGGFSTSSDRRYGNRIIDVNGHGTATASVLGGLVHGVAPDVDVLLVAVQGLGEDAVRWATSQPWIDVVSNSWAYGGTGSSGTDEHATSRAFTQRGGIFAVAAGNGLVGAACVRGVTPLSPMAGPSWNLIVGAVSPKNGQPHCWHNIPPDVSSYGSAWPAAAARSLDGEVTFGGTSNATPIVAGAAARLILEARRAVGDTAEGPAGGTLAAGASAGGAFADGRVTAHEVERAVLTTATVDPFSPTDPVEDPTTVPNTPAYPVYAGYGLVNAETTASALEVLFGRAPAPDRSDVDTWMTVKDAVSDTYWSN